MTAEQTDLFDSNTDFASRAAGKFSIAGEGKELIKQEALIGLQKAVLAYDPARGAFQPFAGKVIRNHLYSACRSAKLRQVELLTLDEEPDESWESDTKKDSIPDREPTPARESERNEIRMAVQESLASLTDSQKAVMENYAKGGSFADVARETGASEQAVRQMFQRGVNQMRASLESRGVSGPHFMPASSEPDFSKRSVPPFQPPEEKQLEKRNSSRLWVICAWVVIAAFLIWLAWITTFSR